MKIYVIVDAQNDFIDGVLGTAQAQIAVPKICKTLWKETDLNSLVLFTKDTHFGNYLNTAEGRKLPIEHCKINSYGWNLNEEIIDAAAPFEKKVYEKYTFSSSRLIREIYNLSLVTNIESITLMGFCTDICVISNALALKNKLPEVPIYVKADCCGGTTFEKHRAALDVMESCQIEIV